MNILAPGVVHLSFEGGGMFLPFRTPYDRQTLLEHIVDRVRCKNRVQVLIDKRRWLIDRLDLRKRRCCSCGRHLDAACYDPSEQGSFHCLDCVFGPDEPATQETDEPARRWA